MTIIEQVVQELKRAKNVLVITGAGMSADSGLPTYRGVGGLYEDKVTDSGIPIETALSGAMMLQNPELCWKYISQIERACRGCQPNVGHEILAKLQNRYDSFTILTQNVDQFHRRAGSDVVIEIHGSLGELFCTNCEYRKFVIDYSDIKDPSKCPQCYGVVRPSVVLFDEMLPEGAIDTIFKLMSTVDIIFSIGTTSTFPYIAAPIVLGKRLGIPTVEVNPSTTEVTHIVDYKITQNAAIALQEIYDLMVDPIK